MCRRQPSLSGVISGKPLLRLCSPRLFLLFPRPGVSHLQVIEPLVTDDAIMLQPADHDSGSDPELISERLDRPIRKHDRGRQFCIAG